MLDIQVLQEAIDKFNNMIGSKITSHTNEVFKFKTGKNLVDELNSGKDHPDQIECDLTVLINEIEPLELMKETIDAITGKLLIDFNNLLESKSIEEFSNNLEKLAKVDALEKLPGVLQSLLKMNVGLALSFIISVQNLPKIEIEEYGEAIMVYLFNENGYQTVSGKSVTPPKLFPELPDFGKAVDVDITDDPEKIKEQIKALESRLKNIEQQMKGFGNQLKAIGTQVTAERFIRDITRIGVEVTGDQIYNLRDCDGNKGRYKILMDKYSKEPAKKLVRWFDSFGDLAEASVLPVVESIMSGASDFQLNPLIAAGIGTFCSVTVRKATEHAYLPLLGITC